VNGSNKDCLIYKYLMYAVVDFSEHEQSMGYYFEPLFMAK
jgi:EamA domain-containing membrane protein RarD